MYKHIPKWNKQHKRISCSQSVIKLINVENKFTSNFNFSNAILCSRFGDNVFIIHALSLSNQGCVDRHSVLIGELSIISAIARKLFVLGNTEHSAKI